MARSSAEAFGPSPIQSIENRTSLFLVDRPTLVLAGLRISTHTKPDLTTFVFVPDFLREVLVSLHEAVSAGVNRAPQPLRSQVPLLLSRERADRGRLLPWATHSSAPKLTRPRKPAPPTVDLVLVASYISGAFRKSLPLVIGKCGPLSFL